MLQDDLSPDTEELSEASTVFETPRKSPRRRKKKSKSEDDGTTGGPQSTFKAPPKQKAAKPKKPPKMLPSEAAAAAAIRAAERRHLASRGLGILAKDRGAPLADPRLSRFKYKTVEPAKEEGILITQQAASRAMGFMTKSGLWISIL